MEYEESQCYNKIKKDDDWEEITLELHTTVDECEKKMGALLSALKKKNQK